MDWIADFMSYISGYVNYSVLVVESIFNYFDDAVRYLMVSLAKASLWLSYQALLASMSLVDELLQSMDMSSKLNSAWSSIAVRERQLLAYFRFPEIVNILFSAISSKFAMRFIPGSGV